MPFLNVTIVSFQPHWCILVLVLALIGNLASDSHASSLRLSTHSKIRTGGFVTVTEFSWLHPHSNQLFNHRCLQTPSILSWKVQADAANVYNTPNIFSIWALEQITADLIAKGGLEAAGKRSRRRAQAVS